MNCGKIGRVLSISHRKEALYKIEQNNEREAPVEYQKMYYTLMAAISEAMELLTRAQQQCEEWYINANTEGQPPTR